MQRLTIIFLAIILSIATGITGFGPRSVCADVIYVDVDATGSNNGDSWENAFIDLQDALVAAQANDSIWVAEGIYKPSEQYDPNDARTASFQMKNNVGIYGGFNGAEENLDDRDWTENIVILSGDIGITGDDSDNTYHVFYHPNGTNLDSSAILDGFTITAGNANSDVQEDDFNRNGGGMNNWNSTPTLTNCLFSDNYAQMDGGAICNFSDIEGTMTLANCTFSDNEAGLGGAIWNGSNFEENMIITNCTFSENIAENRGGAIFDMGASTSISDCTFSENHIEEGVTSGGAIYFTYSMATVNDCTFSDNSAGSGGAIHIWCSSPVLTNCVFTGNSVTGISDISSWGGAILIHGNPVLTNCSFSGNSATGKGGGVHSMQSYPELTNCTFSNNTADDQGGGIYIIEADWNPYSGPVLENCIFTGNSATGVDDTHDGYGGGMYIYYGHDNNLSPILKNCTFSNNTAIKGGGVFNDGESTYMRNCNFYGNSTSHHGGAIYNKAQEALSAPRMENCIFTDNSAGNEDSNGNGGGMYNIGSFIPVLENCIFTNNSATGVNGNGNGGGMYNMNSYPYLKNCIFTGNSAIGNDESRDGSGNGGGLYNYDNRTQTVRETRLINCTFFDNHARWDGGGIAVNNINDDLFLTSCILEGDSPDEIFDLCEGDAQINVTYSNIQDGYEGEGNIDDDSFFEDPYNGDFHLQDDSPCIDAGNPDAGYNDICFPPGQGSETNDMGAFGGPENCVFSIAGTAVYWHENRLIPDTKLYLDNEYPYSSFSDDEGNYILRSVRTGDYTLSASKDGDINGITAFDAARVAQYAAELYEFNEYQIIAADVTGDGTVTSFDAARIAQYAAGLEHGGSRTGTWTFIPEEYTYTPLNSDLTDQNFIAFLFGDVTGNWTPPNSNIAKDAIAILDVIAFQFMLQKKTDYKESFLSKFESVFPGDWDVLTSCRGGYCYVGGYGVTSITEKNLISILNSFGFNQDKFESFYINDKQIAD